MRSSILALAAAAGLAAVATGAALAQPDPAPPREDPLGEATLSRAEAATRAGAMFDRMDANHDGTLDAGDRAARIAAMFDRIDANHDGALSREEFTAAHQAMAGPHGMMGHGLVERGMMGHGPDHAGRTKDGPRPGAGVDQGPVGRKTFVAEALKRFDAADANRDGKLTPAERRAAAKAGRRGHHGHGMADMPPPTPAP